MKPFNLQEALAGKPVVTRNGRKVTELHYFATALPDEQLVYVADGKLHSQFDRGSYYSHGSPASEWDLLMAEEPREIWVNIYPVAGGPYPFAVYPDRKRADAGAYAYGLKREALIRVTLLDGKATAEVIES